MGPAPRSSTTRLALMGTLAMLAACSPSKTPSNTKQVPRADTGPTVASAQPSSSAAPPPTDPPTDSPRFTVPLRGSDGECTFRIDHPVGEGDDAWIVARIGALATERSAACDDHALEGFQEPLKLGGQAEYEGGAIYKPGKEVADLRNMLTDLSFDGYADLCLVIHSGAFSYSHACWLFDPQARRFRRYAKLDEFIALEVDESTKKLTGGYRLGGNEYNAYTLSWKKGDLFVDEKRVIFVGARPDGTPLPEGHNHESVYRGPAGTLAHVEDRVVRAAP